MSYISFQNPRAKRSGLVMLMISLVSLFALGCGGSQEDYVFTGNNNNNAGTGNVVFQFVKPQAATVPADTATLAFDFYNTADPADGTLIFTATSAFANTVTVINVPAEARSVVITAYDADGHPKATIIDEIVVLPGVNNPTDLSNALVQTVTFDSIDVTPDPVALILGTQNDTTEQLVVTGFFSNGESIAFTAAENAANGDFFSNNQAVATVAANGLVSAVSNGNTTIDVDYTVDGVTRSLDGVVVNVTGGIADVLDVTPNALTVEDGTNSGAPSATFAANGGNPVDVTGDAELTYALQAAVAGITVNSNTGVVSVAANTADGVTATVVATYLDGNGNTDTDTIAVTVGAPEVLAVNITAPSANITLPDGDPTDNDNTGGGFAYQIEATASYSDGTLRNAVGNPDVTLSLTGGTDVATLNTMTGVLTTGGETATTVIAATSAADNTISDSFTLTVTDMLFESVTATPTAFALETNDVADYTVVGTYEDGTTTADISNATIANVYAIFVAMSGTDVAEFAEGEVTSGATTGSGDYDIEVNGGFVTNTFAEDRVEVTVTAP